MMKPYFLSLIVAVCVCSFAQAAGSRQVINLNGEWQFAKTEGSLPTVYRSVVQVPGLVDLAIPSVDTVGVLYKDGWYWHKRTFSVSKAGFDLVQLKIFKAKYHTKVYINGQYVGENCYCFTPSYFDIKPFLKAGQTNEIVIGVGCKEQLPDTIPNGNDVEKIRYIPGIYDNVEITCSNKPFIDNIQCVPDIKNGKLRVVAEIETASSKNFRLNYAVSEMSSKRKTVTGKIAAPQKDKTQGNTIVDFEIDMKDATLWTPARPFLYELSLNTGADSKTVRFGMRSFRFDTEKKVALLNEEPCYLRGTNICIYRFFEDPDRAGLPWNTQWVTTLHKRFKDMNWDIARYCIGFPPEKWYDICDSLGFMVQDEFPLWGIDRPNTLKAPQIAAEYRLWMRERWNHPCVVIWDGNNETISDEPGAAIKAVRELDLSNRPWENGWSEPTAATDPMESHPYLFIDFNRGHPEPEKGYKKEFFGAVRRPHYDAGNNPYMKSEKKMLPNPSIINEYGWIWLNRDGTTTTLTDRVYETLWKGSQLTAQERLYIYARNLAMLTEFWRAHRQAAGVLHFCGLGYSRSQAPRGQTSDHFVDIRNLTFEPTFYKYVKSAFAPVGLMIDVWEKSYQASDKLTVPIYVVNDLVEPFEQDIVLTLQKGEQIISTYRQHITVKGYETGIVSVEVSLPKDVGDYLLKAKIRVNDEKVFSLRDIPVTQ
jgi:hypothetical protein